VGALLLWLTACDPAPPGADPEDLSGVCVDSPRPPQALRLLSRREYEASLRDLLASVEGASCEVDLDCAVTTEACLAGTCTDRACGEVGFALPGSEWASPVVAGDFNGWQTSVASGALPLTWDDATGHWIGTALLPDGDYQYKFVSGGTDWFVDPGNPAASDDGYGGQNSLLSVACRTGGWAADVPPETRPDDFPFDSHTAGNTVSSRHLQAWLDAGAQAADRVAAAAACEDEACETILLQALGRRAWRRPLTDPELAGLLALARAADLALAVEALLSSPYFLYRSELGGSVTDGVTSLTAWERATALSYTLWGTLPDEVLLDAAEAGLLDDTSGLITQAHRLLDDPRAAHALRAFGAQWLGTEAIGTVDKNESLEAATREALDEEVGRLVAHVALEGGGTWDELFTTPTTLVNESTAGLYGIQGVSGAALRQADLPADRAGILGLPAVLAVQAHSDQTSPIRRGLWVREHLLCQSLGVPPAEAASVPVVDTDATTRERFAQHTADPFCAGCHDFIDPIGFGFEGYDTVGRWRDTDNGQPVDTSGDMVDVERLGAGTSAPFESLPELAETLVASKAAPACFAMQTRRWALGVEEPDHDNCETEALAGALDAAGHDVRTLLVALVSTPSFHARAEAL